MKVSNIELRLFGNLRRYAAGQAERSGVAIHLPGEGQETVGQILTRLDIDPAEVGNLFINGRLLPRSVYPITLGYPLAARAPLSGEAYLDTPVRPGDRLGIFPRNMSSVVV